MTARRRLRAPVALLAMAPLACAEAATWPALDPPPTPVSLADGWATGTVASQGLDPTVMALLDHDLRTGRIAEVDALLIARNGVLVYEGYFHPGTAIDRWHQLNSATKSVVSMVVGAAVQQGLLDGYDVPIADLLADYADVFDADPRKGGILLRHALTMTSGLEWDSEPVASRERDDIYINDVPDALRYVLEKPLVEEPGSRFRYSSANSMLLTGVVQAVSGQPADAFAAQSLFAPLGITDVLWQRTGDGTTRGMDGLHLRGRDLLKLGQLYLQGGVWNGQPVIPAAWVDASFEPWVRSDWETSRYGFQWWLYPHDPSGAGVRPYGILMASGFGGQKLFVIPDLQLVAVFYGCTSGGYDCGNADTVPETVLYEYILRAVEG